MTNVTVNTAATVEAVEDMVITPVRDQVAVEIHALLDIIGTSYLKVGSLLNEARADFDAQKEFLAWAEAEFGIKKAQCYNLMNVARVFEGDSRFEGVAMRVMLALCPVADEAEIMEKAAALAHEGKLDTAAVNALTGKQVKPAVSTETGANAAIAGIKQAQEAAAAAPEADKVDEDAAPFDMPPANAVHAEYSAAQVSSAIKDGGDVSAHEVTIMNLQATIEGLNATIQHLQAKLDAPTPEREVKRMSAPMLPHFKSANMAVRLGLTEEEASKKTAVNKAKRELVKAGYNADHEAFPLIMEAVEALTK